MLLPLHSTLCIIFCLRAHRALSSAPIASASFIGRRCVLHLLFYTDSHTAQKMTAEDEAKQLDSVTDRVQEKELDASRANEALGALSSGAAASSTTDASKTIAVKKEDVDLIVTELEVTEDEATEALRKAAAAEGSGNLEGQKLVAAALRMLVVM